jgi:hypothetical protein
MLTYFMLFIDFRRFSMPSIKMGSAWQSSGEAAASRAIMRRPTGVLPACRLTQANEGCLLRPIRDLSFGSSLVKWEAFGVRVVLQFGLLNRQSRGKQDVNSCSRTRGNTV